MLICEFIVLAAANGTDASQPDPYEDLPFNYVPTGWVGIVFLVLFGVSTGRFRNFSAHSYSTPLLTLSCTLARGNPLPSLVHDPNPCALWFL